MNTLRIRMFGGIRLTWENSDEPIQIPPSAQSLLSYLLLYRNRHHHRDALADLFWSEAAPEQARRCLSTALWRLRCQLEPAGVPRGTYLVATDGDEIGFNRDSDYRLDVAIFEAALAEIPAQPSGMTKDQVAGLESALSLYIGDLLDGCYTDWAILERERLRLLYLKGLKHLMRHHQQVGNFEAGIACAQAILQQDPLREEIHRDLMRLYLANGQRALAVRQYQTCEKVLAQELNIPPMVETQMLYERICSSDGETSESLHTHSANTLEKALADLEMAQRQFAEASQRLEQAIEIFRSLQAPEAAARRREHAPSRNGLR
jgi:DNA-binding SARP family transcriptional activator